jgi:AraC-like DNA-binding protein
MRPEIIDHLREITAEEQELLTADHAIRKDLYTSEEDFIIESEKLLRQGKLIDIRRHTRFGYFPPHGHDYIEMIYVVSGQLTHIVDNRDRIVQGTGDLLFLNKHARHEILPAGENDLAVNFIILPEFFNRPISMIDREDMLRDFLIASVTGNDASVDYLYIPASGIVQVENLMENMIFSLLDSSSATDTIIQNTMGLLFQNLSLYSDLFNQQTPDRENRNLLFSVLKYIEDHYQDGTLEEISAQTGYPTYFVSRILKRATGSNFKQLLQKRKLQQAAYLLENSTLPVDTILTRIGYENSSYFYRKFREQYGCAPSDHRALHSGLIRVYDK